VGSNPGVPWSWEEGVAKRRGDRNLVLYVAGVVVAGIATLIGVPAFGGGPLPDTELGTYAMLTAIIVLGELFPVTVTFRNEKQDVTTSTTFAFAVLLMFGPAPALVAQALASITSDVIGRKVWWKAAFNVSQYTLSWGAAALVLMASETRAGDFEHAADFAEGSLPFLLGAAAAFFLVNSFLIGAAVALAQSLPVLRNLRHHIGFYASSSAVLFSLSPIVVVVATQDPLLVPLLLAPIGAAYHSAQVSMEKEHQAAHDPLTDLPTARSSGSASRRPSPSTPSGASRCSSSTSTTSRRSTTRSVTRSATSCSRTSPAGCAAPSAPTTWWRASAATSSRSSPECTDLTHRARSRARFMPHSRRRSSSTT
jgi:hypothetical protein